MTESKWLSSMLVDHGKIAREATKRRKPFQEASVAKSAVDEHLEQGWEVAKELKIKTRLKKPFSHDENLENRVWHLFYLLGYPEISSGRNFNVLIKRKNADPIRKQIDVLAKDDETVIVTECKSSERITKRSLQKDIEEFSNLKGPISNAIKKHYGSEYKPKIIWLFVTSNIVWSEPDKQRAKGANIQIVTEKELRYYVQIADHLRGAARFQFLAEFLQNQKIPELDGMSVPCTRGKLGGKMFYSFVSTPRQMLKISFVNHRSLNDPAGAPSYQRLVSRSRLRQISKFIHDGGFFSTNILVNFTTKPRFEAITKDGDTNAVFGNLYLPNKYRSAWIIDGQHRLYGYAPLTEKYLDQNIMVVAFERLKKEEEANLFVTINHEQKSVPKTLLDDLEGELKWGSEKPSERIGAISARLIGMLNNDIGEPLYGRVTQQGIPATEKTCLTVPALKDGLRRSKLVGESILNHKEYSPGPLSGTTDSESLDRARAVLNAYFQLLVSVQPNLWHSGREGFLCTNIALQAYLMLLSSITSYMESEKGINARELEPNELIQEIEEYLDPILTWLQAANLGQMEKHFKVQFGSGGPKEYYFRLSKLIRERFSDFSPDGMDDWEKEQSEEHVVEADRKLKDLNILVQKAIFDIFKEKYGLENDAYWNKGISDKKIKTDAYSKSLDDEDEDRLPLENYLSFIEYKKIVENKTNWPLFKPVFDSLDDEDEDRLPLENYLSFIEYKKIVENKTNWPLFKPVFDIPEPGEKGYSKNIRWMERINELRRIPAHPTEKRHYKTTDFEYIDFIHEEFSGRVSP